MHQFKAEQFLPIDKNEAWTFFSSPKNLAVITPPEMDFKILTKLNEAEIYEGMKIDYTVKPLFGIKVNWQTEICSVENQRYFTDRQTKGPYKVWEHKHSFLEMNNGVLMTDEVNYELHLGFIGRIAERVLVRRKINSIFNYRKNILNKLFV
jgi:ligand-binding SRPBCC domain-containing protein